MADNIESRIDLNIDVSSALASIKTLQSQISAFHQSIRNSGNAVNQAVSDKLTKNLLNNINSTQKFSASLTTVSDSAQSFTNALEKNKLSMGQYFKYGVASTKSFGRVFKNEFNTIEKVSRERVKTLQTQFIRMGRDATGALEAIKVRPLRLDMEQLGTQVAMTAQKQQLFNQLVKQGSTNLLNFGKNTQWAGRQLMVGFTIPLSIMGGMAIKEFEKIEKQAIRFKRVYGDAFSTDAETDAALENMRTLAMGFAKYGIEIEKTLELAADAAQMGLKGSELRDQVTEATRLAVLGEVEQQEALKATISITNAFGIASSELASKIDFLNAVENETLTAISDLTIAIPKAGPVVKQLGGDVEDLAFFLTAMKEGGINASEGANALKSGLAKLINPTEKASLMLQGFGINLTSIVEQNAGDIKSTVLQFAQALDTLDPLNRARAIEELFGRFQFARISTLFENITREGSQAQRVLELSNASAAQLAILSERELKRVEDSPIFKFEKALERLQATLAPLGEEFLKIITPLLEFGTDVLKNFNNMEAGAKAFVTNIVTILGLIAPIAIMTFGLLANGVANFIKGINFVRTMFGKLAGAGTGLNQMTQYMTQEQLEATASASSLGQAHSQLTTVFTSERAALDGLVRSYNNAIIAMQQYNNVSAQTRVRPGSQTKKYAAGVISVPGPKGAGDIIPAMLSPGEAVIPAEEAQRYRGLISAIIANKIPGFKRGATQVGFEETHMATPLPQTRGVLAAVDRLEPGFSRLAETIQQAFIILSDLTATKSERLNQAARGMGLSSKEFSEEWNKNAGEGFVNVADRARSAGQLGTGEEIDNAVKQLDIEIGQKIASAIDNGNIDKSVKGWLDQLMADVTQSVIQEFATSGNEARQEVAAGMAARAATPASLRTVGVQNLTNPSTGQPYGSANAYFEAGIGAGTMELRETAGRPQVFAKDSEFSMPIGRTSSRGSLRTNSASPNRYAGKVLGGTYENVAPASSSTPVTPVQELAANYLDDAAKVGNEIGKNLVLGTKQGADQEGRMASPSKEMYERGKDLVRGMVQGVKDGIAESSGKPTQSKPSLPKPPGPPPIPGFEQATPTPPPVNQNQQKGRDFGKKIFDKAEGLLIKGMSKTEKGRMLLDTFAQNAAAEANIANGGAGAIIVDAEGNVLAESENLQKRREIIEQEKLLQNQEALIQDEEQVNLYDEEGNLKTRKQLIEEEEQLQKQKEASAKADRRVIRQDRAQRRQARAGKALGALGTMTMVAGMASGMEGKVGEIARGAMPALAGLSAIAPILLALPAPLALLAAGVGAAAFAIYKWNDMINKAREEGRKFGNALTMTTDELIKLSEQTGRVSATEERRAEQETQLAGEDSKARKYGQTFLESDAGKAVLDDIKTLSSQLPKEEAAAAIGRQLATGVAQGIFTSGEISSIAVALGQELNDYSFAANVQATIIDLIGPNGEDLAKNPLQVLLAIQEKSLADMAEVVNLGLDEAAISDKIKDQISGERLQAAVDRDIKYAQGGWDGFVAGIEGWAADGFGFNMGGSSGEQEIGDFDPQYIVEKAKETERLQSASIQIGINQVQQNQQLLDSLEKQYDQKVKQKQVEIDAEKNADKKLTLEKELNDLYSRRESDLATLNSANAKSLDQIIAMQDKFDAGVFDKAIKTSVLSQYGEDDPMRVFAEETVKQLSELEDSEFKTTLQLSFASGELSMEAVNRLLGLDATGEFKYRFGVIMDKRGIAESGQLLDLMIKAGLSDTGIESYVDIFSRISTDKDFENSSEALAQIANMNQEYGIKIDLEASSNAGTLEEVTHAVEALADQPAVMTKQQVIDASVKDPATYNGIIENWNTIVGADDVINKAVIIDFRATGDMSSINRYLIAQGMSVDAIERMREAYGDDAFRAIYSNPSAAFDVAQGKKNKVGGNGEGEGQGEGGGGSKQDPLANILSQLKRIRNAAINAGGGVTELVRVLGDSAKEMKTFRGVSQKLLGEGFSREFVDAIMGMDEGTRNTFVSIENGIIKVTEAGRALNKAFAETSLGEYQNTLAETAIGINAQVTAMSLLTAEGVPLATASEMVQDKTLAIAIAAASSTEEIMNLKAAFEAVTEAEKAFVNATPEGRRSELEAVIAEANSYFSAQETMYNQQYEAALKAYEDANEIVEAQRDLADKEFELDDLNFALNQIAEAEQEINDEYDKREEAIENIYKANKAVIDQDKEKLDIAGALASGDLAAAAKAMRAQTTANLERQKEAQLENLQRSRELEIAQIRDDQGRSRLDLETAIRDIEKEIAEIQEYKLEPYQREIDLLDRIRQDALKDVQDNGFLGLTQSRWTEIANEVDRARFNVEGYADALRTRLSAIPGVTVGDDGSISVDANQIVAPAVDPTPTETPLEGSIAEANPNQAEIDELNRLRKISREKYQASDDEAYKKRLWNINVARGQRIKDLGGIPMAMGGLVKYMRMGGLLPYKAEGGSIFKSLGTDTVPAMLTPGEFVVRRHAVSNFGVDKLRAINSGTYNGESVYNYSVNVNVKSDANPDEIARNVMTQIKRIDSQRIRGNKF